MAEDMKIQASEIEGTEFGKIDERFEKIEYQMTQMGTKEEFTAESKIIQQQFKTLMVQIEEQDKRLSIFQKVTYAFLGVFSGIMLTILVLVIKLLAK